ncbi:MAG: UbiA family prenyltransferase [Ginsengibacter sp.]
MHSLNYSIKHRYIPWNNKIKFSLLLEVNKNSRSTLQLLRFHFSFFLMPVYWFALSQVVHINRKDAILVFIILHLLVYPASNGYNSYMDRDTGSIGGLKNPLQPTKQLFYVTVVMDIIAVTLSFFITWIFAAGIFFYIMASRAYSYRGIRLKKFPIIGYLTVVIFQGAVTFYLVYHGSESNHTVHIPVIGLIAAGLLIGGFYPLTQIYQHEEDIKDGVKTISYKLGYRGTFTFTGIIYALAFSMLALQYALNLELNRFFILQIFMLPVLVYFFIWFRKVWINEKEANFKNTMRMNLLASSCTNLGFITLLIIHLFE